MSVFKKRCAMRRGDVRAVVAACVLATGVGLSATVRADCSDALLADYDWLQESSLHGLRLTAMSTFSSRFSSAARDGSETPPEFKYLSVEMDEPQLFNYGYDLRGRAQRMSDQDVFSHGAYSSTPPHFWLGHPHPFNPHQAETITVRLDPTTSRLWVGNDRFDLECDLFGPMRGKAVRYLNWNGVRYPSGATGYLVQVHRFTNPGPPR